MLDGKTVKQLEQKEIVKGSSSSDCNNSSTQKQMIKFLVIASQAVEIFIKQAQAWSLKKGQQV